MPPEMLLPADRPQAQLRSGEIVVASGDPRFDSIAQRYLGAIGHRVTIAQDVAGATRALAGAVAGVFDEGLLAAWKPSERAAILEAARAADVSLIALGSSGAGSRDREATPAWAKARLVRPLAPERLARTLERFVAMPPKSRRPPSAARPSAAASAVRSLDWSSAAVREIVERLYAASGNVLHGKDRLRHRLEDRMAALEIATLADYAALLRTSPDELATLVDAVAVNETYFFRAPDQIRALSESVLPLLASQRAGPLRLWSAGCSCGPEPYTLAMLCSELLGPTGWEVHASDVDRAALAEARAATYPSSRIARTPPAFAPLLARHLVDIGGGMLRVAPAIARGVHFRQESLLESPLAGLDLVVCRNVLIYFDAKGIDAAANALADATRPGGLILLGSTEILAPGTAGLERVRLGGVTLYRKPLGP